MVSMPIRENIRRLISEKGYRSVRGFANANDIDYVYLNAILNKDRRLNETMIEKIGGALGVELYDLYAERPLVPYENREPTMNFNMPEAELEGVKVFEDPICLGPGYNMDDLKPAGYMPIPKADLPRGYRSDKDRVLCFRTAGYSMEPTINDDSYVWIDRFVDDAQPGGIYAFLLEDNTVTVKRLLSRDPDYLVLGADNCAQPGFPKVLRLHAADEPSVIRGRVVWIMNRLIPKPKK